MWATNDAFGVQSTLLIKLAVAIGIAGACLDVGTFRFCAPSRCTHSLVAKELIVGKLESCGMA
jgi:hypothetical protein